jgi:hypothetical protein
LSLTCFVFGAKAQLPKIKNLQDFDERKYHFGFLLGYNSSDFVITHRPGNLPFDTTLAIRNYRKPGFNLGIISSLKLTNGVRLRFLPSLAFQDREVEYRFYSPGRDTIFSMTKKPEPTYLEFPLLLKFRTNRINNWASYVLAGGKYGIDMSSDIKTSNSGPPETQVLKIKKTDLTYEIGGGFDFFLEYFKLGLELKLSMGAINILYPEPSAFSNPIDKLRSRTWTFSITFEG